HSSSRRGIPLQSTFQPVAPLSPTDPPSGASTRSTNRPPGPVRSEYRPFDPNSSTPPSINRPTAPFQPPPSRTLPRTPASSTRPAGPAPPAETTMATATQGVAARSNVFRRTSPPFQDHPMPSVTGPESTRVGRSSRRYYLQDVDYSRKTE